MERIVTVAEVKSGEVDIIDLTKINALLDMKAAYEQYEHEKASRK